MESSGNEITVMFADIVGSARLYEIVGDEIIGRFSQAEQAIVGAKEMPVFLAEKTTPSRDYKIAIRIGAHQRSIIESDGDIFGDTVNIAARVASLARAGKGMMATLTNSSAKPAKNVANTSLEQL